MGDLPAAGRYWFLTPKEGQEAKAARAAMTQRHRGAAALLTNLPIGAELEAYPPIVRERLLELAAEVKDDAPWLRFTPKMRRVTHETANIESSGDVAVIGSIVAAAVGPWLVGVGAIGYGIWKLLT